MNVFQAIDEMRQLSSEGKSFSFSFMSYSYERRKSDGVITVNNARLRKQSHKENNMACAGSLYCCLLMIMNLNWADGYQV